LFDFHHSISAQATFDDDEPSASCTGEAAAIRVLYQTPPRGPSRPSRGRPVREWFARVLETLLPHPAPVPLRVPAYARVRR
jgi:hypothetical protein